MLTENEYIKLNDFHDEGHITTISKNELWIGGETYESYSHAQQKIYTMIEDSKNNFWLGTLGEGLIKFNKNNMEQRETSFTRENSGINSNNVYSIMEDKNEKLWIGTSNGLNKFDGKSFLSEITTKQGLPDNLIYGIIKALV